MKYKQNPKFRATFTSANNAGVRAAAKRYKDEVSDRHRQAPRGGRGRNSRGEFRSAPDEVPAPDTRRLLKAFTNRRIGVGVWAFDIKDAGARLYAAELEYGHRTKAARPMFRLVLLQSLPMMRQDYLEAFRGRFK